MPQQNKFDLLIIGAGPAGSAAADAAAQQKRRVALIEKNKLGGTCLNYGCDPTKTMLQAAHLLHQAQRSAQYGLNIPKAEVNWDGLLARLEQVRGKMRGGTIEEAEENLKKQGIELFKGEARFVSPHEVEVNGQKLWAEQILIASGTVAAIPPVPGLKEAGYITNIEAVSLAHLPKRLAILGGGPIGIEFAQVFQRFGVEVSVFERSESLLDTEDYELADMLCNYLQQEGIRLEAGAELKQVEVGPEGKRLSISFKNGKREEVTVDEILVATGRELMLEPLNLEAAGLKTTEKGLKIDETLRTSVPHIWAAGDIVGKYQFTHVAGEQGKLVVENAFGNDPKAFDNRVIPWGVYTKPELGHLGQTEEELKEAGTQYKAGRYNLDKLERAIIENETVGMVKLLLDKDGKLLGGHILADNAGDLLAPLIVAMRANLPISVVADAIQPYPTMAEAVRYAAQEAQ